jgi:hypothetical protein
VFFAIFPPLKDRQFSKYFRFANLSLREIFVGRFWSGEKKICNFYGQKAQKMIKYI